MLLGILNSQAAGGGGGAFDLLETTTLTSSASSVSFTGLGSYSDYAHLQIRFLVRSSRSAISDALVLNVNGDTGNNYRAHMLRGSGSSVTSAAYLDQNRIEVCNIIGDTGATGNFNAGVMDLLDFASTSKNKTFRQLSGQTTNSQNIEFRSGLWQSTSAITSLVFAQESGPNFVSGTRFSLYGIKGA
jgi:hypothetical protein